MKLLPDDAGAEMLTRSTAEVAADLIRKAILEGQIQPGAPLREEQLASELGISRTPVREALLVLQTEGIVEAMPNRGSYVRAFELAEIIDLYETRAFLEGHAAGRAASRITSDELLLLEASCARHAALVDSGDPIALVHENGVFHDVILQASRSVSLAQLVATVRRVPLVYRAFYWYAPAQLAAGLREHELVVSALAERDEARAESLMRAHILESLDVIGARFGGEAESGADT
jgi:DNA-binding GntR family transcriptional regulator